MTHRDEQAKLTSARPSSTDRMGAVPTAYGLARLDARERLMRLGFTDQQATALAAAGYGPVAFPDREVESLEQDSVATA